MRAARRQALLDLGLRDRRFGWPLEMVVRAGREGWRIHEVEVPYAARRGGRSKVTGTARGTIRTIRDMSRVLNEDRAARPAVAAAPTGTPTDAPVAPTGPAVRPPVPPAVPDATPPAPVPAGRTAPPRDDGASA
jgi:hypothetical protein